MSDTGYRWENPDDESLPLTRCVCGTTFSAWRGPILSVYPDHPTMMPCCGRRLWWSQVIMVHEARLEGR